MTHELNYTDSLGRMSGRPFSFRTRQEAARQARIMRGEGFLAAITIYEVTGYLLWKKKRPVLSFPRVDAARPKDPLAY